MADIRVISWETSEPVLYQSNFWEGRIDGDIGLPTSFSAFSRTLFGKLTFCVYSSMCVKIFRKKARQILICLVPVHIVDTFTNSLYLIITKEARSYAVFVFSLYTFLSAFLVLCVHWLVGPCRAVIPAV